MLLTVKETAEVLKISESTLYRWVHNKKINYGNEIVIGNATTSNFSKPENFVVLECVDRLLEKGYKPKNIELEKIYPSGHGHSGNLDILVKSI